ncbi:hypothetical protein ACFL1G_03545 [Planctomycetota bacterium]
MINKDKNNICSKLTNWLSQAANSHFGFDAGWVQRHIANCPRCQRRMASLAKVNLAFSLLKSQPHNLDLLMRANTQAIGVLKHSLRYSKKAQKLRKKLPEPGLLQRLDKYKSPALNAAACVTILFLMKTGIFSSAENIQDQGQQVLKQYYVKNLGQDLADEIFTT